MIQKGKSLGAHRPFHQGLVVLLILGLFLCGAAYIIHTNITQIGRLMDQALKLAKSAESFVPAEQIKTLDVNESDLNKGAYLRLKDSLIRLKAHNSDVVFTYLYTQINGTIYFLVDSELPNSPGYSPPGQIFDEASEVDRRIFEGGKAFITQPATDRWGTWVSALVPVNDPLTGEVIAVLGMDYDAGKWSATVMEYVVNSVTLIGLAFLLLAMLYRMYKRNQQSKQTQEALRESERSKSVLLSHLPGMAYRCMNDPDWTMQFVSEGCFALTGYPPESLLHNKDISFNDLIHPKYRDLLRDEWSRVLVLNNLFRYEYEIITASGERKWVLEMGQGIYNVQGDVEALEGIVIDITESKRQLAQIQHMNDYDFLTGILSRKYFEEAKHRMDSEGCLPLSIIIADINGIRMLNNAFGYEQVDLVIEQIAKVLQNCCREGDILARTGGDEFGILLPGTGQEESYRLIQKMKQACESANFNNLGDSVHISLSLGCGTKAAPMDCIDAIEREAEENLHKNKILEQKSYHSAMLTSIMATMNARSQETEEHAQRLVELSRMIGSHLALSQKNLDDLQLFAMLHDIGKVGIDDRILNKPGKLSEEEWIIMKKHPEIGYRIAISLPELSSVADFILTHHERFDGKGYPKGLKGEEIPLLSRILAVADAYDAITQERVYRKKRSDTEAMEEIMNNSGTQFDPAIVEIFAHCMRAGMPASPML